MYLDSNEKKSCCGCSACEQICPRKCIKMENDENGFTFPKVDAQNCVQCNLCRKVCPFDKTNLQVSSSDFSYGSKLFALTSKNENIIMNSASGGAFEEIVRILCENKKKYAIWGAAFDNHFQLRHIYIESLNDLELLKKSKYLQSNTRGVFQSVGTQLNLGYFVVFSGTPCQIAALRCFLSFNQSNMENLFCIDLVCHGVPNQMVFDSYIENEGKHLHSQIKSISFRNKEKKRGTWDSRTVVILTENGRRIVQNRYQNRYLRAYYAFLDYRESCHSCVFAQRQRQGDITIGDFWGIQRYYPQLDVNHGVSLLQINSAKGFAIFDALSSRANIYEVNDEQYFSRTSGAMRKPSPCNKDRNIFFSLWQKYGFDKAVDCLVPAWKIKAKILVASRLSPATRSKIKNLLNRIRK